MASSVAGDMAAAAATITRSEPMFWVRDMRETLAWYRAFGFTVEAEYEEQGELLFARVRFGNGAFALGPEGNPGPRDVRMWFFTDDINRLYEPIRRHREDASGKTDGLRIVFEEELYEPFYGGRQFSVRDCNGLHLVFYERSRS